MEKIEAVIFDMDGLMLDSERITFEEYRDALKQMDLVFDEAINNRCLGKNKQGICQVFYDQYGANFPMEKVWDDVHERIDYRIFVERAIKDGLIELLVYLKKHNIKTAIATSSNRLRVDRILNEFKLGEYFDASVCGNEVSHGKPDPEIFLMACNKLTVSPINAIVLEDSESGIMAGHNGGIRVIAIPDMKYPDSKYAKLAFMIVDSLKDVLKILSNSIE